MDRWQQYLFEEHPETELRAWARRLKLFRFFRAFGGHANDGDSLDVASHCEIMGIAAFVWCSADSIKISVGDRYTVSEKNVQNAEKIETLLTGVTLERIDPPLDTKNYICPRHYPDYFS